MSFIFYNMKKPYLCAAFYESSLNQGFWAKVTILFNQKAFFQC